MADISLTTPRKDRPAAAAAESADAREPYWDLIELLFFAYRDFVSDPDQLLDKLGFGRAHHRVLHFVNRNPGMKVAELLDVLKITKQSLGRVLKQLIDEGYVVQKEGADRRQRLLYVSPAGEALALKLANLQTARIGRVLDELGPEGRETANQSHLVLKIPQVGSGQIGVARHDRRRRVVDQRERQRATRLDAPGKHHQADAACRKSKRR